MSRERLFELAALADEQLNEFYAPVAGATQKEEERRRGTSVPRMAVRGGALAAGAAGAGLAYKNREALGGMAKDAARKGLKKTARGAGLASNALYKKATAASAPYGNDLLRRGAGMASGKLARISKGMRGVARGFEVEQLDRIVDLAAKIEELEMREFAVQHRSAEKRQKEMLRQRLAGGSAQ